MGDKNQSILQEAATSGLSLTQIPAELQKLQDYHLKCGTKGSSQQTPLGDLNLRRINLFIVSDDYVSSYERVFVRNSELIKLIVCSILCFK